MKDHWLAKDIKAEQSSTCSPKRRMPNRKRYERSTLMIIFRSGRKKAVGILLEGKPIFDKLWIPDGSLDFWREVCREPKRFPENLEELVHFYWGIQMDRYYIYKKHAPHNQNWGLFWRPIWLFGPIKRRESENRLQDRWPSILLQLKSILTLLRMNCWVHRRRRRGGDSSSASVTSKKRNLIIIQRQNSVYKINTQV